MILLTLLYQLDRYLPLILAALPLLAALVTGLGGKQRPTRWSGTGLLALVMLLSWYLLWLAHQGLIWEQSFTWLPLPDSALSHPLRLGIRVDFLVAVMIALTTTISFWVHLYAIAYLKTARRRYTILTSAFVSAMLAFWMADNLLGRFIGWEFMGWGSYLLIGFWYQEADATRRSTKAWLINQVGSISLFIGILLISSELGTWNLMELSKMPSSALEHYPWLGVARFYLVAGLCAKSAQFPWFSWLSSAMKAPTPASALIHSATLVGAGVYWLAELAPILDVTMLTGLAYLGALTALMGAYAALAQPHAKQVLAYSTISQLGYMVMAVGVGAGSVGMLHFIVHAFAKACLFLCVGVVSQFVGTGHLQAMGGLRQRFPVVFGLYLLATCSLLGVPGFAGAFSKEAILTHAWAWARTQALMGNYWGYMVPGLAWGTSVLAVAYLGRQGYLIFMGKPRWIEKTVPEPAYRTPRLMQLSIGALALGTLGYRHVQWIVDAAGISLMPAGVYGHGVLIASLIALVFGGGLYKAWQYKLFPTWPIFWCQLSLQGWHLDTLMNSIAQHVLMLSFLVARFEQQMVSGWIQGISSGYSVLGGVANWIEDRVLHSLMQGIRKSYMTLGHVAHWIDRQVIAGLVIRVASAPRYLGSVHRMTQQGSWQQALAWILIGIGLLLSAIYYLG